MMDSSLIVGRWWAVDSGTYLEKISHDFGYVSCICMQRICMPLEMYLALASLCYGLALPPAFYEVNDL